MKKILKFIYSMVMSFFALILFFFFKRKNKTAIWLICEQKHMARDNGAAFFKYCCENNSYKNLTILYVIDKKSNDYKYISQYEKNIIQYGSFMHFYYYIAAKTLIMAFPDAICPSALLEKILRKIKIVNNNKVYLKHGIIKDNILLLHYEKFKTNLFITAARNEYDYIKKYYGFPKGVVQLLGLARYDLLEDLSFKNKRKQILIMPTWRRWIKTDLQNTEYFKTYEKLIFDLTNKYINNDEIEFLFYMHNNFQKFSSTFNGTSKVKILSSDDYKVNDLINTTNVMITDYSSVAMDFAYLNKPVLYFQFDYERVRKDHYQEGYFDYRRDGFGSVNYKIDDLLISLDSIVNNKFINEKKYSNRINKFFEYRDKENCKRTFDFIKSNL